MGASTTARPGPARVRSERRSCAAERHRFVDLYRYERRLARLGLEPVAGVDEAGRGACAGPLVVAAVILASDRRNRIAGLADSKQLTPAARESIYNEIISRALAWSVVVIPSAEVDELGVHAANIAGMRRAVAGLAVRPAYVLTDGFSVAGLNAPGLAVCKGDEAVACIAAASVVAKVTRDRLMVELHEKFPVYEFATHKGYVTAGHRAALARHGPCPEHRRSFVTVRRAGDRMELRITELAESDDSPGLASDPAEAVPGPARSAGAASAAAGSAGAASAAARPAAAVPAAAGPAGRLVDHGSLRGPAGRLVDQNRAADLRDNGDVSRPAELLEIP